LISLLTDPVDLAKLGKGIGKKTNGRAIPVIPSNKDAHLGIGLKLGVVVGLLLVFLMFFVCVGGG
jgi:hypothetical protein